MAKKISVAMVGDFDANNRSHAAMNESLEHCGAALGLAVDPHWIGTEEIGAAGTKRLVDHAGVWIAPASPYRCMIGALLAIRAAREGGIPLLGTCGGFQHVVLEYARNVLGMVEAEHEETNPGAAQLFLSRLTCSLVGRTMAIALEPGSRLARLYGATTAREEYHCNYGVNPKYAERLGSGPLRIVASDEEGAVRAVELPSHPFFVGTLFLPQQISTRAAPHPLIKGFVAACQEQRKDG